VGAGGIASARPRTHCYARTVSRAVASLVALGPWIPACAGMTLVERFAGSPCMNPATAYSALWGVTPFFTCLKKGVPKKGHPEPAPLRGALRSSAKAGFIDTTSCRDDEGIGTHASPRWRGPDRLVLRCSARAKGRGMSKATSKAGWMPSVGRQ